MVSYFPFDFNHIGLAPWACYPLIPFESFARMRNEKCEMRNGGAAQIIMKRRRILIALRAVVISSVAERSSLQNGQCTDCAISITTFS